jgi:hypothetical protein
MHQQEICQIWIEYIKELKLCNGDTDFKKKHGETASYQAYIDRVKEISKTRRLTPWPSVRKISDIIEDIIDRAHSEAIRDGDISFEHLKKRLMFDIKLIEQTNLLLHIHCGGISPRGGQKTVLAEIGKLINAKIKDIKAVREIYQTWTEPNDKVVPEVALYLKLYQAQKHQKMGIKGLEKIASDFAEISIRRQKGEKVEYNNQSQIRRMIDYAKRILQNVEYGFFPGDYKSLK